MSLLYLTPLKATIPFSPKNLPGLVGWWDPSKNSSITYNGAKASAIADLSGNGNTLSQSTSSNQPTPTTNAINGLQALSFPGVAVSTLNCGMINNSISSGPLSSFTLAMIAKPSSSLQVGQSLVFTSGSSGYVTGDLIFGSGQSSATVVGMYVVNIGNDGQTTTNSFPSNTPTMVMVTYDGTTAKYYINSTTVNANSTTNLSSRTFNKNISWGGQVYNAAGGDYLGFMGEFILCSGVLSAGNLTGLVNYLNKKWGT